MRSVSASGPSVHSTPLVWGSCRNARKRAGPVTGQAEATLEQFHIENGDCSGSRGSDYPQPNIRKNHAFSVV